MRETGNLALPDIISLFGTFPNDISAIGVGWGIYLSHMAIFRVIEKAGLNKTAGNGWLQYVVTTIITLCGAVIFSVVLKKGFEFAGKALSRKAAERQKRISI